jgi:DNA-binding NarL/FixJ family response regulator
MEKIRIVLVEDHDLTRIGLRTALQQHPKIEVIGEAENGRKGIELIQSSKPDVAIVDIGLPDMDGIEITTLLKHRDEGEAEDGHGSHGAVAHHATHTAVPHASASHGATKSVTAKSATAAASTAAESEADYIPKILILTMHDNEESVLAAFAAGADSYSVKDVSIEKLVEAIESTHGGNAWIDPAIARIVLQQAQKSQSLSDNVTGKDTDYEQLLEADPLTDRELEGLELIVDGYSNAAIAEELYITVGTVKTHVRNILSKLCAADRTQAAVRALRAGLVSL